ASGLGRSGELPDGAVKFRRGGAPVRAWVGGSAGWGVGVRGVGLHSPTSPDRRARGRPPRPTPPAGFVPCSETNGLVSPARRPVASTFRYLAHAHALSGDA